jgi:hypothetical protein
MANVIDGVTPRFESPDDLESQVREYAKLKASIDFMESRQKELREKLFAAFEAEGFEDDKGNLQLPLENEVEGIVRLEKQRRVSRKLNEPKADEILSQLGIKDEIFVLKPVLEEDALMAAFYEGKITEEQLDDMYPSTVTWALRTLKN